MGVCFTNGDAVPINTITVDVGNAERSRLAHDYY